jgi:hypothetical protein
MNEAQIFDRHGRKVTGSIVPDGGKITVPLLMMDAAPDLSEITHRAMADTNDQPQATLLHRPGSAVLSDGERASRERAIADRDARLVSAYKSVPALDSAPTDRTQRTTPLTAASAADARDARLRSAWEG